MSFFFIFIFFSSCILLMCNSYVIVFSQLLCIAGYWMRCIRLRNLLYGVCVWWIFAISILRLMYVTFHTCHKLLLFFCFFRLQGSAFTSVTVKIKIIYFTFSICQRQLIDHFFYIFLLFMYMFSSIFNARIKKIIYI